MKNIIGYLFVGALSLMPVALVLVVLNMLKDLGITAFFTINDITNSKEATGLFIGVGLILFIFLGFSLEKYGKSFIVSAIDKVFENIPAVRSIYGVMKKLTQMFSGNEENGSKEIVLVEYPKDDLWVAAYVINKAEGLSVLFVPSSPIPTSGYTVIVKNEKLIKTSLTLEEASKFIISMGADFGKKHEIAKLILKHEK
jgi:uncharacterized membrane protein